MKVKVVNTITGEIMEFAPKHIEDVIAALIDIKGLKDALERAEKKLKGFAGELLGDEPAFEHPGLKYRLEWRTRNPQEYNPRQLRAALDDEDLFMDFVTVRKADFQNWLKERVEELPAEIVDAIDGSLEYTGKASTSLYLIKTD